MLQQILNDVRKESSIIEIGILIFYGSIAEAYIIDYRSILYAYKLYCRSIEEIILYGKSEFNLYFVSIKSDQLAIKEKFESQSHIQLGKCTNARTILLKIFKY